MMEKKMLDSELEELLVNKNFDQLNSEEKAYVSGFFGEAEYAAYAFVLRNARSELRATAELQPSPRIKAAINEAIAAKNVTLNWANNALFKIAASVVVVLGFAFIFYQTQKNERSAVDIKRTSVKQQNNTNQTTPTGKTVENIGVQLLPTTPTAPKDVKQRPHIRNFNVVANTNDADLCKDVYIEYPKDDIANELGAQPCSDPSNTSLFGIYSDGEVVTYAK